MALDEPIDEANKEEDNEPEEDLEGEIISTLQGLSKTRELKKVKYVATEKQDCLKQSLEETKKTIFDLKLQFEEAKTICEVTTFDLINKEKEHQNL